MDTNETNSEAETNGPDLQLEYTPDNQLIEVTETEAEQEKELVTSYIESWVGHFGSSKDRKLGHFGSSKDRKQGKRDLCFSEGLGDVVEQVSYCLEALPVLAETMTAEAWQGGIGDGLCIIAALISEAANMTIQALDQERKLAARENRELRKDLERAQSHSE